MGFTSKEPFSFCTLRIFWAFSRTTMLLCKSLLLFYEPSNTLGFISDNFRWMTRYSFCPPLSVITFCIGWAYNIDMAYSLSSLMSLCIASLSLLKNSGFSFRREVKILSCCLWLIGWGKSIAGVGAKFSSSSSGSSGPELFVVPWLPLSRTFLFYYWSLFGFECLPTPA